MEIAQHEKIVEGVQPLAPPLHAGMSLLGRSRSVAYEMLKEGHISKFLVGRNRYVEQAELESLLGNVKHESAQRGAA